ncbi:MAG: hypothetical protein PHG97_07405, partial [Candidatus Margulisbacteria bacterium]|nr:hypothetical protein [Candidatus Margulisiibacteriota bacterium]
EVAKLLRKSALNNVELIKNVIFPIFHETSIAGAQDLMTDGIDFGAVWGRWNQQWGHCFYAGREFEKTLHRGMKSEAMVAISAAPDHEPKWLDVDLLLKMNLTLYNFIQADPANCDRERLLPAMSKEAREESNVYWLSTLCAEIGASALTTERTVFIYDSFEAYMPSGIIDLKNR